MSSSWTTMLALPLLILAVLLGCRGEDQDSLDHRDATLAAAMKEVSHVLRCFGSTMQESLHLQKLNSDALSKLNSHPDAAEHFNDSNSELRNQLAEKDKQVAQLTESTAELVKQLQNCDRPVEHFNDSNSELRNQLSEKDKQVAQLTESTTELVKQLQNCDRPVEHFNDSNSELRNQLAEKDKQVTQLTESTAELIKQLGDKDKRVQELEMKLSESQRRVEELEKVQELNNTEESRHIPVDNTEDCKLQELEEIKAVVRTFSRNRDWGALRRGLEPLLDHSSEAYKQLSDGSMVNIGYRGHSQLALLLLCGGLPANTGDNNGDTMLNGAAWGSHLHLVELLVAREADIDVKGYYDWTPLMRASSNGHLAVVKWLLKAGADTTLRDKGRNTALDLARKARKVAVVEILEQQPH